MKVLVLLFAILLLPIDGIANPDPQCAFLWNESVQIACDKCRQEGVASSCFEAGQAFEAAARLPCGITSYWNSARSYYQTACSQGMPAGCSKAREMEGIINRR